MGVFSVILLKLNKLAKARKTRKSPCTLGLRKFRPGKLWVEKVLVSENTPSENSLSENTLF